MPRGIRLYANMMRIGTRKNSTSQMVPGASRAHARACGRGYSQARARSRTDGHYASSRIWQSSGSQATAA